MAKPLPESVEHDVQNGVGIWTATDAVGLFTDQEALKQAETHYEEVASDPAMSATIIQINDAEQLGSGVRDSLDHISDQWSELADSVDVDRLAYVADGLMAMTVKAKIDADVETESFDSVEKAVEWCTDA